MKNSFWLILLVIVGGMFAVFSLTSDDSAVESSLPAYDPNVVQLTDNIIGIGDFETQEELDAELDGKVVMIEYADFQCPACASFYPVLKQIEADFEGRLAVVFRHFPLTNIHPQAMAAHRAAVAAANQGTFWLMHDQLYQTQASWTGATDAITRFKNLADDLNLDMEKYAFDVDSLETFNRITVDGDSATPLGISATPSIIIDGELLSTTPSYAELTAVINEALAAKTASPATAN